MICWKVRGLGYRETLGKCCWKGVAELVENEGEGHCFHPFNPSCDKAEMLMKVGTNR